MKKIVFALSICLFSMQLLHAQAKLPGDPGKNPGKDEQELLDLSKTKWTWMADKNIDALNGLFADKCVFVHMGGSWG